MGPHLEVRQGEEELRQPGQLEEEDVAGTDELGGVAEGETCAGRGTRVSAGTAGVPDLANGRGRRLVGPPQEMAPDGCGHDGWYPTA